MSLSIFYYIQFSILHFIFIHPFSEYLLSSIEGDCELAQQSGSSSDGGRTGEGLPLLYNSHPTLIGRTHHACVSSEALAHHTVAGDGCHGT